VKVYVLDASAWVKRYKNESGSNSIDALFQALEQGEVESCLLPVIYYDTNRKGRVYNCPPP
jgi:predicted nucleic acid-binding protein